GMVPRADVGKRALATRGGRDVSLLGCVADEPVEEALHGAVALEVAVDDLLGLRARDAELLRETEGRLAVHQAEVDRLGDPALLVVHPLRRHPEELARRP